MFLIKQLISCLRLIDDDDYVKIDVTRKDGGGGGGNADNDNNSEEGKKTRAMVKISYGSGGRLAMRRLKSPQIERDDQVLIRIVAAGVHSSDMLPTCSIPGQDCSGIITAVGDGVTQWKVGDKMCAILDGGGGYAEEVLVSAGQILAVPSTVTLADAASLPYAACNICLALSTIPQGSNKSILINGATTEIGVIAIQVAKYWGFKVIATAGTKNGMYLCRKLGADISFDETDGEQYPPCEDETVFLNGVDIVLECGACIEHQIRGRMKNGATRVIVELDMASKYGLNLNEFCLKNRRLKVVNIRRLSKVEKASIVDQVRKNIWPAIEQGKVKPRIAYRAPLMAAMSARKLLTDDERYGSVLLYPCLGLSRNCYSKIEN